MDNIAVGIDLGTSNSSICVYNDGDVELISDPLSKSPIVPSIVALNKRDELLVGESATSYLNIEDHGIKEVKRMMGSNKLVKLKNDEYRPEEISALILKKLKNNLEKTLDTEVDKVVISVPANFEDSAREATISSAEIAGLNVVRLINEPTAAALSFGVNNFNNEEQILVFDWGGGTLDITTLEMFAGVLDVKASIGNPNLGGKDIDQAFLNLVIRKFRERNNEVEINHKSKMTLKSKIEEAKKTLSSSNYVDINIPFFAFNEGEPIDLEIEISRREFEKEIKPILDEAKELIFKMLDNDKINIQNINRVLLVGGTTYIPAVRKMIKEIFGQEPKTDVNPDLAVAMGAAIDSAQAQNLIDPEKDLIKTDVAPYGLGTKLLTQVGSHFKEVYDPLIEPNTTIPYSTNKVYTLLHSEQEHVNIRLYQDPEGGAKNLNEVIDTGIEAEINDIPKAEDGMVHPVEIEFSYDVNGIAKINAKIPTTGQSVDLTYKNADNRLNYNEKQESINRINNLWEKNPQAKRYEGLINKAEKVKNDLPEYKRDNIEDKINNLKKALIKSNQDKNVESLANKLTDLLFELENEMEG